MHSGEFPIHSDPDIMGGTPVFVGSRVPAQTLCEYLAGGETLDDFLDPLPTVRRKRACAALRIRKKLLLERCIVQ